MAPYRGACRRVLFDAMHLLGVSDVSTPRLPGDRYPSENPFAV